MWLRQIKLLANTVFLHCVLISFTCVFNVFFIRTSDNCKVFCDTQEQYIFVHDAVRELLLLGDTTIKAGKMRRVITQLNRMGDDRDCGYHQQFAVSGQI